MPKNNHNSGIYQRKTTIFAIYEKGENTIIEIGYKPFKLLLFFLSAILSIATLILKAFLL